MKMAGALGAALLAVPGALAAQAQQGSPPDRIDLLAPESGPTDEEAEFEDCSEEQEAASISGEIIVCRRKGDTQGTGFDKEAWEKRYADKTRDKDDPRAPDLEPKYPGVVVARGCFIGPCPPPPVYYIDVTALPQAPPGSDADRIARGLAPLGRDATAVQATAAAGAEELGLPPPASSTAGVNPSGSASPAEEPPG